MSKQAEKPAKPEPATPKVAVATPDVAAANAKAQPWRVLLPLRHGQTVDGKRISRTWQPGQTIELTPAQAAPLLARRVIEEQKP